MEKKETLLNQIKNTVHNIDPNAKLIVYGSYARGDYNEHSDLDLLNFLHQKNISEYSSKFVC